MKHREVHPQDVPGCFGCRILGVQVAPSAVGSTEAREVNAREDRWNRDMPAYKMLRRQGYQPPGIDGCADRAARAVTRHDIEATAPTFHPDTDKVLSDMGMTG